MRKLIVIASLAFAGMAYAGDYHYGEELKCQQCHTMHYSRAHGFEIRSDYTGAYNSAPNGLSVAGGPFAKLLVGGDTNAACLSCHNRNGTSGYDVYGTGGTGSTNGVRSGGALNRDATTAFGAALADPGLSSTVGGQQAMQYQKEYGHSLGATGAAPGGSFANPTTGFNCGDCHEVHGNAAYRNLGPQYSGTISFTADQQPTYTIGATVNTDFDVTETEAAAYVTADVKFGYANGANRMNAYCAACHGNFHSGTNVENAAGAIIRHPTGEVGQAWDFATSAGRYTAKDVVRPVYTAADRVSPGCLTCHKGHGNARPFALIYPGDVTNANFEEGDELSVRDHRNNLFWNPRVLCNTCHYQGKH